MSTPTLPRQGAALLKDWSLVRDNQFRSVLEAAWQAAGLSGIRKGGKLTKTAALAVALEVSTEVVSNGVSFTTDATTPQAYSGYGNGTVRVYGLLTRTAANQNTRSAEDTYTFVLSHTTNTTTAPSADHILLGVLTVAAGDTTNIDNDPPGKRLGSGAQRGWRPLDLAGTGTYTLSDTEARDGILVLSGLLTGARILVFPAEAGRSYLVYNGTTGAFSVTAKVSGGTGGTIPQGEYRFLYVGATDVVVIGPAAFGAVASGGAAGGDLAGTYPNPTVASNVYKSGGTDVAVADGGTGASSASAARTNLGLGTIATQAQAAADANDSITPSVGYVQAEAAAVVSELHDLKDKLRTAGILAP